MGQKSLHWEESYHFMEWSGSGSRGLDLKRSFVVGKDGGEAVKEDPQVVRVEGQTRSQPDSGVSANPQVYAMLSHLSHNPISCLCGATVNCAERSQPTCLVHQPRKPELQILKACQHICPNSCYSFQKLISLYGGKHCLKQNHLAGFTHPSVENTRCMFWGEVCLVINSSGKHFLAEGDNVRPIPKIEVLVHPHLSCCSSPSLNFINDQIHSILLAEVLHSLEPVG